MSETAGEGKPTKEESITEEPAREDPAKGDPPEGEPTTEEPTTEKPTTEEPTIEKPANEKLTTEEQTTEEPPTEEQTTEEPSTEEPSTEEPSTEDPTTEVKLKLRKSVELQQQSSLATISYDEQRAGFLAKSGGSDEVDANTLLLMQQQGNLCTLCLVCTLPAACCFWIPMIFFMAAANVPDACTNKDDFALWLRVHGLAPLLIGVVVQALAVVFAIVQAAQLFKFALRTQILVQLLGGCFTIWGWAVYGGGDASCNTAEDVRPRTLALVWLVLGSICLPCVIIGSIRRFINFDVDSEAENARLFGGEAVGRSCETE